MKCENHLFCADCDEYVDLWRYEGVTDAGHTGHAWRFVTPDELDECVENCEAFGCFEGDDE